MYTVTQYAGMKITHSNAAACSCYDRCGFINYVHDCTCFHVRLLNFAKYMDLYVTMLRLDCLLGKKVMCSENVLILVFRRNIIFCLT